MRTLIDKVFELDTLQSRHHSGCRCHSCQSQHRLHSHECNCSSCRDKESFNEMETWGNELSDTAVLDAVDYNTRKAVVVGWANYFDDIVAKVLKLNYTPINWLFAHHIAEWQYDNGLTPDGKLGPSTWNKMKGILGLGTSSSAGSKADSNPGPIAVINAKMPASGTGYTTTAKEARRYGVPETIQAMEAVASEWYRRHPEIKLVIRDISKMGGGRISGHVSHRIGLDVDLQFWAGKEQILVGTSNYEKRWKPFMQELATLFRSNPVMNVQYIFYHDTTIKGTNLAGKGDTKHKDHFHIRFCMPAKYKGIISLEKVYSSGEKPPGSYVCRSAELEYDFAPVSPAVYLPEVHLTTNRYKIWRSKGGRAYQLNEPGQPPIRSTSTATADPRFLLQIVDWMNVERSWRYVPEPARTFCNIYAYDYCTFAGAFLPRVWWKDEKASPTPEQIAKPRYSKDVHELSANSIFKWFGKHGSRFGWSEVKPAGNDYTQIQNLANQGHVVILVYKNPTGHGHLLAVIPESEKGQAKRVNGKVIMPVHSQAGRRNFAYSDPSNRRRNNAKLFEVVAQNKPSTKIYVKKLQ